MRPTVYALSGMAGGSLATQLMMVAFEQNVMAGAMMLSTVTLGALAVLAFAVDRRVRRSLVIVADELCEQAANNAQGLLYNQVMGVKHRLESGASLTNCAQELGYLTHALEDKQ